MKICVYLNDDYKHGVKEDMNKIILPIILMSLQFITIAIQKQSVITNIFKYVD